MGEAVQSGTPSAGEGTRQDGDAGEFRRGWRIVVAAMIGICFGLSPMPIYTMGVFAPHLAQAFGWSIGQIMGALTVTTLAMLAAGPMVGWLSGRYSIRRVVLVSQILFGLSFMALGFSNGSLPLFYINWAIATFAGAGTLPITWTRSINNWFDARRGLALGMAMMGTGLFGMLCKPVLAMIIPDVGWRGCYILLGFLPIVIGFPVTYFLFRETGARAPVLRAQGGLTFAQAMKEWRFWLLMAAILPISFALGGPVPNLENMLAQAKITPATIIELAPMIGFSALLGRILGGWLLDRFWAPAVGCVILSLPAISCYMLASSGLSDAGAAGATFLIGFALGIEYDLMAYLVSRYFGMKAYSAIYSLLYVSFALGAGFGPMLMGRDFDLHGSYRMSLLICCVVLVVSALSLLLLGRYRTFPRDAANAAT